MALESFERRRREREELARQVANGEAVALPSNLELAVANAEGRLAHAQEQAKAALGEREYIIAEAHKTAASILDAANDDARKIRERASELVNGARAVRERMLTELHAKAKEGGNLIRKRFNTLIVQQQRQIEDVLSEIEKELGDGN